MFEKRESETENQKSMTKVPALHLRLQNWGLMWEKVPGKRTIQASSNLE